MQRILTLDWLQHSRKLSRREEQYTILIGLGRWQGLLSRFVVDIPVLSLSIEGSGCSHHGENWLCAIGCEHGQEKLVDELAASVQPNIGQGVEAAHPRLREGVGHARPRLV